MPASPKVIELRRLLSERHPGARARRPSGGAGFVSGIASLDEIGLPKGAVTELVCPGASSGGATAAAALLAAAARSGWMAALVDGADSFDPQSAGPAACARLLWARCESAAQAVQAADLLLRDGNLPFVLLDLRLNADRELRRIGGSAWHRLQTLAAQTAAMFVVMSPRALAPSARLRAQLDGAMRLSDLDRTASDLLAGMRWRVTRRRLRSDAGPGAAALSGGAAG